MSDIFQAIYDTVVEMNRQLPEDQQLAASPETVIVGDGGVLDSLGVINFLVALEERLSSQTGQSVTLLDDNLINDSEGPLKTLGRIEDHIKAKF